MRRDIRYDHVTQDFRVMCNGELLGYAKSYLAGEQMCNDYAYKLLSRQPVVTVNAAPMVEIDDPILLWPQSSLEMTTFCPTCNGPTHAVFSRYGNQRVCNADRTHERVVVSFAVGS